MTDKTMERIMRICNMDNGLVSLTIFKQLETYNWLRDKHKEKVDVLYREVGLIPTVASGFPEVVFEYFEFDEKDDAILKAINEFNVTTATEQEWLKLKEVFLEVTISKFCKKSEVFDKVASTQ